jgi:hypothetical protein
MPGVLLLLTGFSKLAQVNWFVSRVADYALLPRAAVRPVALIIIAAELVTGSLLVAGMAPMFSAITASVLFTIFNVAMVANLVRRRTDVECGCVSARRGKISWQAVCRNLALVAMLLLPFEWPAWPRAATASSFVICLGVILLTTVRDLGAQDAPARA